MLAALALLAWHDASGITHHLTATIARSTP
jgi:hypothetical protein